MLYIRSSDPIYLVPESLCPFTNLSLYTTPFTLGNHLSPFCFYECDFFYLDSTYDTTPYLYEPLFSHKEVEAHLWERKGD